MSSANTLIQHDQKLLDDLNCSDALSFQNRILKIRKFDDTIVNILNVEIPTESFYKKNPSLNPVSKCQQFKKEMHSYYDLRENAIRACVEKYRREINEMKNKANESASTTPASLLKDKILALRIFQQELDVEQIHRARSLKAVEERCRNFV